MKKSMHCLCGASGSWVAGRASAQRLMQLWSEFHQGDGHGSATAKQAAAVRRRQEQEIVQGQAS